jgi:hypothetical protein
LCAEGKKMDNSDKINMNKCCNLIHTITSSRQTTRYSCTSFSIFQVRLAPL